MQAWDFLVDRANLSRTTVQEAPEPDSTILAEGEALLEIERFSLTANNITYGVVGDRLGYWRFFPAPEGWGRIPVWGFARVVASRADGVSEGLRLYGYWPMSTHLVARLRPQGSGYIDSAEHRALLPPAYNLYEVAAESDSDDHLALLRPLFTTSFLLDDWLGEVAPDAVPILSSASSRTAIGLAWMLAQRDNRAVGLTAARNRAFVERLGLYRQTFSYDDIDTLQIDWSAAFVDMAGDAGLRASIHRKFGERLVLSARVGSTHHDAQADDCAPLSGPSPSFFFAPDRLVQRRKDWGGAVLGERITNAMAAFIEHSPWLTVQRHYGADEITAVYRSVFAGTAEPTFGHVLFPNDALGLRLSAEHGVLVPFAPGGFGPKWIA